MRQVEREIIDACQHGASRVIRNTEVVSDPHQVFYSVKLHDNLIYSRCTHSNHDRDIIFSFARWDTNLTRSRLKLLGLPISRNRYKLNELWLGGDKTQRWIVNPNYIYKYSWNPYFRWQLEELGEYPESEHERSRYFESIIRV